MAPKPIAIQAILDLYHEFGVTNDLIFDPIKAVCTIFKPSNYKLYCPPSIGTERLTYLIETKYLEFSFVEKQQDDNIDRQMRPLYVKNNRLIHMLGYCNVDKKLTLFKSYCTSFYC